MYKLCHFYIPRIQELQVERDMKDVGKLERDIGYMWSYFIEYMYEILKNKNVFHTDTEITEAPMRIATILIHMDYITTATAKSDQTLINKRNCCS